ncbi:MAG: LiaF transmembrane domain-containing protein [Roseburia sp.]
MKNGRILWGIFFVLAAVYLVVSQMGLLPQVGVFSIILTVFMIWMFIEGIRRRNFFEILFSIAFVLIIYDEQLKITAYTPWTVLGAALLGSIGLSMIFREKKKQGDWTLNINGDGMEFSTDKNCSDTRQYDGEQIRCENNFGTAIRYINSDNFCEARLENNFGSMSVYFDNAIIQNPVAYVRVDNSFGDMKLYIPRSWKVEENIDRAFGGVNSHGRCEGTSQFVLRIDGDTNFGSVQIYYV